MSWEMYEVWAVDLNGHETLIDTTKDIKRARLLAKESLDEINIECIIYRETEDGELELVERLP
jgi:hypothetical protein